mmetsp:Transcript_28598/g.92248  ORF Transcript_28598/g.92248 Transcript_28598/m.92248 type:complete len:480 (-) Transcript_28598:24-1463(-)
MEAALGICRRPLKRFQQPKQSEKGPRWVKDKAVFWCKCCNTDFSVVVRKHHCRHCGHIFCSHCCSNKRTLIKFGYLKPVRLCNKCNASCFKADLLLNAVGLNDINTVTKICEEGCDVHFTTTVFPALTIAANRGSSDMVRLLLRYGADPNHAVPATDSGTVVQCSRCGRTQAAGNIKDNQYECTYCGNFTRHADASDSDHTGITALHAAVQKEGHLDVLVALLEHGANVDAMTAKGNTALMYSSAGGHVECSKVLLEYRANPNVSSEVDLDTPLHKAVREGHLEIVKILIANGAKLSLTNIAGLTPQQLAERCKRPEIAAILDEASQGSVDESRSVQPVAEPKKVSESSVVVSGGKTFEELMKTTTTTTSKSMSQAEKDWIEGKPLADDENNKQEEDEDEDEEGISEPIDVVNLREHERAEELLARLEEEESRHTSAPKDLAEEQEERPLHEEKEVKETRRGEEEEEEEEEELVVVVVV